MNEFSHFFEVRTFLDGRPSGVLPTGFPTEDEAVAFVNKLKSMDDSGRFHYRVFEVTEIFY